MVFIRMFGVRRQLMVMTL